MKKLLIFIAILSVTILAYGYWHSITHGTVNIDLVFAGEKQKSLSKAIVSFMDADGHVLAQGRKDEKFDFINLIHPEAGECHEVITAVSAEKRIKLWHQCFTEQTIWVPTWIKKIRQVQVAHKNCLSKKIPVVISEHNSEWLLWWVPLPHVGGMPYSYFRSSIVLEETDCIK